MTQPWDRFAAANHEDGHATALILLSYTFEVVDADRPDEQHEGRLTGSTLGIIPWPPPPGRDPFQHVDFHADRARRHAAIVPRIGALVAGEDWNGPGASSDKAKLALVTPNGMTMEQGEIFSNECSQESRAELAVGLHDQSREQGRLSFHSHVEIRPRESPRPREDQEPGH